MKVRKSGRGNEGEDNWTWSAQGVINMHCPERWGFLHFVKGSEDAPEDGGTAVQERRKVWEQEWRAREALMGWHYLLGDYLSARGCLPNDLKALQLGGEEEALQGCEYGLEVRQDLPGGYLAYVSLAGGCRMCVRGDGLLWSETR